MQLLLIYVFCVGLPLVGIVGLLEAGRDLRAPRSVAGRWEVQSDLGPLEHTPCAHLVKNIRQPALSIAQSGPALTISVNNGSAMTLAGRIDQNVVTADIGPVCSLWAELHKEQSRATLAGVVRVECPGCRPLAFRAVRLPSRKGRL